MMLQQQPNPRQIINADPGKLLLDNCIAAIVSSKDNNSYNTVFLMAFQE